VYWGPVGAGAVAGFCGAAASGASGRHAAAGGAEGSATPPTRFVVSGGSVAQFARGTVMGSEIRKCLREIMEHRRRRKKRAEPRSTTRRRSGGLEAKQRGVSSRGQSGSDAERRSGRRRSPMAREPQPSFRTRQGRGEGDDRRGGGLKRNRVGAKAQSEIPSARFTRLTLTAARIETRDGESLGRFVARRGRAGRRGHRAGAQGQDRQGMRHERHEGGHAREGRDFHSP